jgi:hypothetical protein
MPALGTPVFAAMASSIRPLPVPLAPLVTVIQGAGLTTVHVQVLPVTTSTAAVPPAAGTVRLGGVNVNEHIAPCVTVNTCPAISTVPVRAAPAFAAISTSTRPLPIPAAPLRTAIHGT